MRKSVEIKLALADEITVIQGVLSKQKTKNKTLL